MRPRARLPGHRPRRRRRWSARRCSRPSTIGAAGEEAARLFGRGVSDAAVTEDVGHHGLLPDPAAGDRRGRRDRRRAGRGGGPPRLAHAGGDGHPDGDRPHRRAVAGSTSSWSTSHDAELGGRALAAGLDSDVGYIGALGSRRTQQSRADWLAYRGITDLSRIHGPAGLDIGADTPAEIAVSILAEALAVKKGLGRSASRR